MWPVFVIPYNFPPWMCMDQSNFMMPLLIPGKSSPGKDFHVFMQPLIKDMMKLWIGVGTYDACTGREFPLHAAFLWLIHDYPGYAMMSGRSTRGFLHVRTAIRILAMSLCIIKLVILVIVDLCLTITSGG
jgi:hypothetical protein